MRRIVIIAACVAGIVIFGGIAALGTSSAPPMQQMVHKDIPVASLAPVVQPAPAPTIIPPAATAPVTAPSAP
ncbi:hypothetical protein [Acetobacter conturbans]|uniref:Uncharacterized protein n=1 Tax=Acetobacter conturbans TaxID=1737472 RepID=A0ABX0JY13_9PROT|nr:hypothetical protein [Acetobacter conturbans]NHN88196.1 hypothetical protein [Acetobacter conturbans]